MKVERKIIEIDEDLCTGCGQCIIQCAEGALEIVDGKAKIIADKFCDGLGACLGECPTGALKITKREAEDFDETAVEEHLETLKEREKPVEAPAACGCPSATMQSFSRPIPYQSVREPATQEGEPSELTHWPVQINLVPPTAPFLKNADLLVAADCTPIAYRSFHKDFLEGRVIMLGCPKFDNAQAYVDKFAQLFSQSSVRSVTVVVMEVPCCQGLPLIIKRGMQMAGKDIPMELAIVSVRGEILKKEKLVA
jgi:ferredoxin